MLDVIMFFMAVIGYRIVNNFITNVDDVERKRVKRHITKARRHHT